MAESSEISWCDATVNFWWGCAKVSPGCARCYADSLAKRWGKDVWGAGKPREDHREGARNLAEKLERQAAREGRRLRVFSASMSDWLDHDVPAAWLGDLLALVARTPHLTWLLLSKRPHLWRERLEAAAPKCKAEAFVRGWLDGHAPSNVWAGTTTEDQQRADERIPSLLEIPARVRFLSCEPLLGPVVLPVEALTAGGLSWIIAGGESGHGARPMHPAWARSLRDQATSAGVAFHLKQWGEWAPVDQPWKADDIRPLAKDERWLNAAGGQGFHGEDVWRMKRVGKGAAGRLLDGRTWDEFPEAVPHGQ